MPGPLTQGQLDRMQCEVPGCTHEDHGVLILTATCHPRAGMTVAYDRSIGAIVCRCTRCNQLVCDIEVAP